jgi:hypothetical protein
MRKAGGFSFSMGRANAQLVYPAWTTRATATMKTYRNAGHSFPGYRRKERGANLGHPAFLIRPPWKTLQV